MLTAALLALSAPKLAAAEKPARIMFNNNEIVQATCSPSYENGEAMVPLRDVAEAFKARVVWIPGQNAAAVFSDGASAYFKVGSPYCTIGETEKTLAAAPLLADGRMLVPLAAIGELFGCDVDYSQSRNIIYIATDSYSQAGENPGGNNEALPDISEPEPISGEAELVCTADSYVRGGDNAEKNFGSEKFLDYKATKDNAYLRYVYLSFDASAYSGKKVNSATLRLYSNDAESSAASVPVEIYESADFDENTVTFNTAPKYGEKVASGTSKGSKCWQEIDVTEFINAALAEGKKTVTVAIGDSASTNKRLVFCSREGDNKPVIKLN